MSPSVNSWSIGDMINCDSRKATIRGGSAAAALPNPNDRISTEFLRNRCSSVKVSSRWNCDRNSSLVGCAVRAKPTEGPRVSADPGGGRAGGRQGLTHSPVAELMSCWEEKSGSVSECDLMKRKEESDVPRTASTSSGELFSISVS